MERRLAASKAKIHSLGGCGAGILLAGWGTLWVYPSPLPPQNGAEGRWRYRRDSAEPGFIGAGAALRSAGITESPISRCRINYRLALFTPEIISFVPPPLGFIAPGAPRVTAERLQPDLQNQTRWALCFSLRREKAGSEKPYYNANTGLA